LQQQKMQQQGQAQQQQLAVNQQNAEAQRKTDLEKQAREQDFNMVQQVLGSGEEATPAPTE